MILFMDVGIRFLLRWLYTLGFTLVIPVVLLKLWWRGRKNLGFRYRWKDRLGLFTPPLRTGGLWIHAVSVGESMAAVPLIRAFQKRFSDLPVTITSTTPTGYARVENLFKGKDNLFHIYAPYDLPGCLKRFLNRVQPNLLVLMETELWPNWLWICKQQKIPVMVVNGRLSPRAMKGYQRLKPITEQMLSCVAKVIAQSESDGARFVALGLNPKRLAVTGNIKFDIPLKKELILEAIQLRVTLGTMRPVWIAANTHAGEEEQILAAFNEIQKQFRDLLLILVPRHPERFKAVAAMIQQSGYSVTLRSCGNSPTSETQILLGDTMGELALFYAASDIAFVGGSLAPLGGHNTLEPIAAGIPVIVGPHVHHFVEITHLLRAAGALVQVSNPETLAKAVIHWFCKPEERKCAGELGLAIVEKNRGAVDMTMDLIQKQLNHYSGFLASLQIRI